ncbi:hypothetical protein [Legionella sp.]|uniref:hypothetical protein n=1 Tax=Legionella sp. TaxID=459 RepID=UPI00322031DC
MITKKGILSGFLILSFISISAYARTNIETYQRGMLIIDKALLKTAQSAGVNTSDISIKWGSDNSGNLTANIQCNDANGCKTQEISVKFSQEEMATIQAGQFSDQSLKEKFVPLFKTL